MSEAPETPVDVHAPPQPPPGFYEWGTEGRQRWWDGERWADQWGMSETPPAQAVATPKDYRGLQIWGWCMAILFPGLGLALGIVLIVKGKKKPGIGIVVLAVAMMILSLIYLIATGYYD